MMSPQVRVLAVWLWLAFGPVAAAVADEPPLSAFRGPADLTNARPYHLLFLAFSPEDARTLPCGQSSVGLRLDVANTLLLPDPKQGAVVEEDTETQRVTLKFRQGLGGATDVTVRVPFLARNGGAFDDLVKIYHYSVGLVRSSPDVFVGRPQVPSYRSILRFLRPDGTAVVDAHPAAGLGDVSLVLKHTLRDTPRTGIALRLGLKLPTGDAGQILGSGGVDAGLDVDLATRLRGRRAVFVNLGYILMQKDRDIETAATRQFQYTLGTEWLVRGHNSIVLQTQGGSRVVRTGNRHADAPPATLSLAFKRQAGPNTVYTFGFTENGDIFGYKLPFIADIGPDATFTAGVEWRR